MAAYTSTTISIAEALKEVAKNNQLLCFVDYFIRKTNRATFVFKTYSDNYVLMLDIDTEGLIRPHKNVSTPNMEYDIDRILTLESVEYLVQTLRDNRK